MANRDPKAARKNWVQWVLIYRTLHSAEVPTRTALAKRLRVAKSALTPLLDLSGSRAPSFETLLASSDASGYPIDVMLGPPPPDLQALIKK